MVLNTITDNKQKRNHIKQQKQTKTIIDKEKQSFRQRNKIIITSKLSDKNARGDSLSKIWIRRF